jgi:hypothetical protein
LRPNLGGNGSLLPLIRPEEKMRHDSST